MLKIKLLYYVVYTKINKIVFTLTVNKTSEVF